MTQNLGKFRAKAKLLTRNIHARAAVVSGILARERTPRRRAPGCLVRTPPPLPPPRPSPLPAKLCLERRNRAGAICGFHAFIAQVCRHWAPVRCLPRRPRPSPADEGARGARGRLQPPASSRARPAAEQARQRRIRSPPLVLGQAEARRRIVELPCLLPRLGAARFRRGGEVDAIEVEDPIAFLFSY
jgi:hypothetical protein